MSGPWSDYQAPAAATVGPWSDYQASQPKQDMPALTKIGIGYAQSVGEQAKGMFDLLSSIVDPHMGQKIGDAVIDAQVDQWHKAKAEYSKGNYANAFRRGMASAVPFIGPLIENSAQKLTSGDPNTIGRGIGDLTGPMLLLKAAKSAPEIGSAISERVGNTVNAAKAAVPAIPMTGVGKFVRTATGPVVQDVVGLVPGVGPPIAHGMSMVQRGIRTVDRIRAALPKTEPAAPEAPAPTGPLESRATAGEKSPLVEAISVDDIAIGAAGKEYSKLPDAAQASVRRIQASVNARAAKTAAALTVPRETLPTSPPATATGQIVSHAESKLPEIAKTLQEGAQRTMPDSSTQTLERVPISKIEGDPGNRIDEATVKAYQEGGYAVHPQLRANPEGGYTIREGHHRILADVRNGADSVLAWTPEKPAIAPPAAPVAAPAAKAGPGQAFGRPEELTRPGAPELALLPGHQKMSSSMAHSAGFDPSTGEPQIMFGPSKNAPGGTLYRYPDLKPAEFQKALDAESFGAYFREHIRPKYKGIRVQVPVPDAPLLEGIEYGKVRANEPGQTTGGAQPEAPGAAVPAAPEGIARAVYGHETGIPIPGEPTSYPARYKVIELKDLETSHNGQTFQRNPNYKLTNDRDYTKLDNQGKVVNNALPSRFDPRFLISDNPDAANGPPVVNQDNNALGGNGRGMMLQRVAVGNPKGAAAYKALLAQKAAQFGIDRGELAKMKQPVLVREVQHDLHSSEQAAAVTNLNKTGTAALRPSERAVAESRRISAETLVDISAKVDQAGAGATLSKVLTGKAGTDVLAKLIDDGVITPQERAGLASGEQLTKDGQTRISKLLLGRFFRDPAQMDSITPAIRAKLERVAAPLASAETAPGWGLSEQMKQALDLIEQAKAHGSKNLDVFLKQGGLLAEVTHGPEAVTLAKALQRVPSGQLQAAAAAYLEHARYAAGYQGPGLFSEGPGALAPPVTPEAAFSKFLEALKK